MFKQFLGQGCDLLADQYRHNPGIIPQFVGQFARRRQKFERRACNVTIGQLSPGKDTFGTVADVYDGEILGGFRFLFRIACLLSNTLPPVFMLATRLSISALSE